MKISNKITLTIAAISIGSILLMNALLCIKYQSTLNNLVSKRYNILATEIREKIENALSMGFDIDNAPSIQEHIVAISDTFQNIMSVKVFQLRDNEGITKFDTRPAGIGGEVPLPVVEQIRKYKKSSVTLKDHDTCIVGLAIKDPQGDMIGGVQIRYKVEALNDQINLFGQKMWRYTWTMCFLALVIIFFFVRYLLFPLKELQIDSANNSASAKQINTVINEAEMAIEEGVMLLEKAISDVGDER